MLLYFCLETAATGHSLRHGGGKTVHPHTRIHQNYTAPRVQSTDCIASFSFLRRVRAGQSAVREHLWRSWTGWPTAGLCSSCAGCCWRWDWRDASWRQERPNPGTDLIQTCVSTWNWSPAGVFKVKCPSPRLTEVRFRVKMLCANHFSISVRKERKKDHNISKENTWRWKLLQNNRSIIYVFIISCCHHIDVHKSRRAIHTRIHHAYAVTTAKSEVSSFGSILPACLGEDHGCCTPVTPCDEGQGDCDTGHECKPGLACGYNNCVAPQEGEHFYNAGDDCCMPSRNKKMSTVVAQLVRHLRRQLDFFLKKK